MDGEGCPVLGVMVGASDAVCERLRACESVTFMFNYLVITPDLLFNKRPIFTCFSAAGTFSVCGFACFVSLRFNHNHRPIWVTGPSVWPRIDLRPSGVAPQGPAGPVEVQEGRSKR